MTTIDPHPPSGLPDSASGASPLITVITVCRNAAETIDATLQSVASQEGVDGQIEHVVVDGASQDSTMSIVKRYPAVRWISEPDNGISDAFNKGMGLATGDYLLYLNADDYLADKVVLADVVAFIEASGSPDWIAGDVVAARDGDITFEQRRYPPSCWSLMLRNRVAHQSVFLKRDVQVALGGFDTRFKTSMDYDLFERLCAHGIEPTYFPRIIAVFSKHGLTSVTTPDLVQETKEVAGRFRNSPLKRLVGHTYDWLRGGV